MKSRGILSESELTTLTVRLPLDVYHDIATIAKADDRSLGSVVRICVLGGLPALKRLALDDSCQET